MEHENYLSSIPDYYHILFFNPCITLSQLNKKSHETKKEPQRRYRTQ